MRGEGIGRKIPTFCERITPAYAGRREDGRWCNAENGDHPRLCGEKVRRTEKLKTDLGSPPPMRGEAISGAPCIMAIRITPAYAGRSWSARLMNCFFEDHPRLCGEKDKCDSPLSGWLGSPPPMRGEDNMLTKKERAERITPAYAGRSLCSVLVVLQAEDHPRLCGEKTNSCGTWTT